MRKGFTFEVPAGTPAHGTDRTAWLIANRKRWQAEQEAKGKPTGRTFGEA